LENQHAQVQEKSSTLQERLYKGAKMKELRLENKQKQEKYED